MWYVGLIAMYVHKSTSIIYFYKQMLLIIEIFIYGNYVSLFIITRRKNFYLRKLNEIWFTKNFYCVKGFWLFSFISLCISPIHLPEPTWACAYANVPYKVVSFVLRAVLYSRIHQLFPNKKKKDTFVQFCFSPFSRIANGSKEFG